MKKTSLVILILLIGSFWIAFLNIEIVKAEEPIVIKLDGSISGTDKIQNEGDYYYLTDNIEISCPTYGASGILVQKDNIVIDGKNFTITAKNEHAARAVNLSGDFNVTIKNFKITGFSIGIIFGSISETPDSDAMSCNNTIIGNTINVTGSSPIQAGIYLPASSSNNCIINNKITASRDKGLMVYYSSNNYLSGNVLTGNRVGLHIEHSENNVLRNNTMYDNEKNFELVHYSASLIQDIDTSNTVNNKPIYYWINQHNKTVPSQAGCVALGNCSGITVQNLDIKNNGFGVLLYSTQDSVIKNNHLENTGVGISMIISQGIKVINNSLLSNQNGIESYGSSDTTISENSLLNSRIGISLGASQNVSVVSNYVNRNSFESLFIQGGERNLVAGNNFTDNDDYCVYMLDTNHNVIVGNSFIDNNGFAIRWSHSYNNTFFYNNFINNGAETGLQVSNPWLYGSGDFEYNTWDNGFEGNYWSDYTTRYLNATEVNGSGIWNVPFFINEVNIDGFPLTEQFDIELATTRLFKPPEIYVTSPENMTYNAANGFSLNFTANKETLWIGYSLDSKTNMTITGNTTLTKLSDGSHTLIVYANDIYGNMGSSDTIYFSVDAFPPIIKIASPKNKTYDTTNIPLNLIIDEKTLWVNYSFDGQENKSITGNSTLTGLSEGSHCLVVFAKDIAKNIGISRTIFFSIETKQTEAFSTWTLIAIVVTVVVVAALMFYFTRSRKIIKPK